MTQDSFTDRLQRAQLLHDTTVLMDPPYTPGVPLAGEMDLQLPAFQQTIAAAAATNDQAQDAATAYGDMAREREALRVTILAAATSMLAYLRSKKSTLGTLLAGAEKVVSRMRGSKEKQPEPPADPGPAPKKRQRGQQSYMEQAGHLRTLIHLLTNKPAYNPPQIPGQPPHPGSLANLDSLLSSLRSYNTQLCLRDADRITTEGDRQEAFEDETTGLHPHFLALKAAVQSQYGFNSTQYGIVRGIEW